MNDQVVTGPPGVADLHMHSLFSDGLHSPGEVMAMAASSGLAAVALTDHDTMDGLEAAQTSAREHGLRLIPGIEISSCQGSQEIHLLAWHFDPDHGGLRQALDSLAAARQRRLDAMLKALAAAGAPVLHQAVLDRSGGHVPGRPHMAAALVAAGHATSVQDAFDRWIGKNCPGFVPLERLSAQRAITLVKAAGGVTGLAHPGLARAGKVIPQLARLGLDALECDHPAHDSGRRRQFHQTAARFDLVPTAGSDFHGDSQRHGQEGSERLSADTLQALEARRR
jgi:predicted metal-dependent phosphoesterase TrpH